jgi:TPR repeat protein
MKNYLSILLIVMLSNIAHSDEFLDLQMKLAREGDSEVSYHLGLMYQWGTGVPKNLKTAVMWITKAAEQGNSDAQNYLGEMYVHGFGPPKNEIKAYAWFSMASANGDELAEGNLKILKTEMTNDQIVKAQKLATKCYDSNYEECD